MNPRVTEVKILENYRLLITFSNSEQKVFDVKPYFNFGIFMELKNPAIFNSVKTVDGTVQWSNEADFCPDMLYLESKELNS